MEISITEALAELRVLDKRIRQKGEFVARYAIRQEQVKDPLAATGGSLAEIAAAMQAAHDLGERKVLIRRLIQDANARTTVTVGNETRSVADWLVWRRDVAPERGAMLNQLLQSIAAARRDAQRQGMQLVAAAAAVQMGDIKPTDYVVNIDEAALARAVEDHEAMLETLDGRLSLVNATTIIDIPE